MELFLHHFKKSIPSDVYAKAVCLFVEGDYKLSDEATNFLKDACVNESIFVEGFCVRPKIVECLSAKSNFSGSRMVLALTFIPKTTAGKELYNYLTVCEDEGCLTCNLSCFAGDSEKIEYNQIVSFKSYQAIPHILCSFCYLSSKSIKYITKLNNISLTQTSKLKSLKVVDPLNSYIITDFIITSRLFSKDNNYLYQESLRDLITKLQGYRFNVDGYSESIYIEDCWLSFFPNAESNESRTLKARIYIRKSDDGTRLYNDIVNNGFEKILVGVITDDGSRFTLVYNFKKPKEKQIVNHLIYSVKQVEFIDLIKSDDNSEEKQMNVEGIIYAFYFDTNYFHEGDAVQITILGEKNADGTINISGYKSSLGVTYVKPEPFNGIISNVLDTELYIYTFDHGNISIHVDDYSDGKVALRKLN